MRRLLLLFLVAGCGTTNFPIGQTPPPGMNAAIQQEVIADAVEAAVAKLEIQTKADWESTAKVTVVSPFSVYNAGQGGEDHGVTGYLRTMVEMALTEKGFHVVGSDVEPDWDITLELRTAGAEVKEEDYVVIQRSTLKAVTSFRLLIRDAMNKQEKPYFIAEGEAISEPYPWRHSILYFIPLPDAKYRPLGEPTLWGRLFSLSDDTRAGFNQAGQLRTAGFPR